MTAEASKPATAATVTEVAPIGFAPEAPASVPSVGTTLAILLVLIVAAGGVLWALRRRFVIGAGGGGNDASRTPWRLAQRLRIGPGCVASFVQRDAAEWMIVESRAGVVVKRIDGPVSPREPLP